MSRNAESPDREIKPLSHYAKVLVDRDAWVFNLIYMVTFGGYIGLTSFMPTLFHDQYGIPPPVFEEDLIDAEGEW